MTPEQLSTLKAAILADSALANQPMTSGGALVIVEQLNALSNPSFIVWKTAVSVDEIMRNGMDWARVDNLSVGKARIWEWMGRLGEFNASKANIRAGIDATWVGTAADLAVRAQVYTHCKRQATRGERLFATGTGTVNDPGTLTFEGNITSDDVQQAREL